MSSRICPECGRELNAAGPSGMCPNCLLRRGLIAEPTAAAESDSPPARSHLPTPSSERTANSPLTEQPGSRIGRYKLLEQIGEGAFGTVWMAEQAEPVHRRVALKIIKLGMDTKEVVARFEAERQALALMDHPNIARVFDGGATESGRPYFVMELVKGVRITDYCDAQRLNTEARLKLFIEVCQAVQHAHQKGVIHRDLKPSNVLVTELDGRAVPKVIDFGIAKATEQELTEKTFLTRFNQLIGTPAYMSPEQAGLGSLDVDTRSDIYSLGVLLYELLTGRTPFSNEELLKAGLDQVLRTIREKEPPKPSTQLSTLTQADLQQVAQRRASESAKLSRLVRGELDWIVMKCLEKDRARRYETANGLARDLQRHLSNEPIVAAAPGLAYQFGKFTSRHRVALATSLAFVLVLITGVVVSTWQAVRANRERDRAEIQRSRSDALLLKMKIARAQDWFGATNAPNGIALLAQILRSSPTNRAVAERLVNELSPLSFGLPVLDSMHHSGRILSARFSPDGKRIASSSVDRTAQIWDAETGAPIGSALVHTQPVVAVAFTEDGSKLLTTCEDKEARLWEVNTGQLLFTAPDERAMRITEYHWEGRYLLSVTGEAVVVWDVAQSPKQVGTVNAGEKITHAKVSRDGSKLVTVTTNQTVQLWDVHTGIASGLPLRHREPQPIINTVEFSPHGDRIVTGADDWTARVWNTTSGEPIGKPCKHDNKVVCARWSEDGTRIVTSGWDSTAQVWNAETGEPIGQRMRHKSVIHFVTFSPQGDSVVTTSFDQTARIWDADTGLPLTEPLEHDTSADYAEFSPDGQWLLTLGRDEAVRVWHTHPGTMAAISLHLGGYVGDGRFSPDGQRIVATSSIGTARIWDAETGLPISEPIVQGGKVLASAFSPDSSRFVVGGTSGTAGIHDARTGQLIAPLLEHQGAIRSVDFSPDGKCLATASADKTVAIWNAVTGGKIVTLLHPADVQYVSYSPDGQMLLTVGWEQPAFLWKVATGELIGKPMAHGAPNVVACFSSDSRFVVSTASEPLVRLWSTATAKQIEPVFHVERHGISVAFSPDVKWVAATIGDRLLHLWDRQTGQPLHDGIKFIDARLHSIQFDPSGRRILVVAANQFRIFDALTGMAVSETFSHQGEISCARFSADGRRVISCSGDGTARIWEVPAAPTPAPAWLPELAEMLVRQSFDDSEKREVVHVADLPALKRRILASAGDDYYGRWARWFFAPRSERAISPFSRINVQDFAQRRIQANTPASLCEALVFAPTNMTALTQLVNAVARTNTYAPLIRSNATQIARHLRQATRVWPNDPNVVRAQARLLELTGQSPQR